MKITSRNMAPALTALGVMALIAAAHGLDLHAEQKSQSPHVSADVPSAILMRMLSLDHRLFASDLVWLEAVNYFGGREGAEHKYVRLAGLLDVVTTLDPDFRKAYLFGGLALSSAFDGLAAADMLLEKGKKRFSQDWLFPFYLGFNAMIYRDDQQRAARFFQAAALLPKSPPFLVGLASRLKMRGSDCTQTLQMLDDMLRSSPDRLLHQRIESRRTYAIWECNFQIIEKANKLYEQHYQRPAQSLEQLTRAGLLPPGGLPDPYGGHWSIKPDGKVVSSTHKQRLGLHLPKTMVDRLKKW